MSWLRRLVRKLVGRDRYHDQAQEVNMRGLRVELLQKRLQVIERRHDR
jgi:hypothetical protein